MTVPLPVLWLIHLQSFNVMFIPKELRLNEFKQVNIPQNSWFFGRPMVNAPDVAYTGDETAVMPENKIDSIARGQEDYENWLKDSGSEHKDDQ